MTEAHEWPIPHNIRFKALCIRLEKQLREMEHLQDANVTLPRERVQAFHIEMEKAMLRSATIEQEESIRRYAVRFEKIVARNQVLQIRFPR